MASILDRYGIKEVADVTFYKINDNGTQGDPVLYLDTLKVSTIEQTAQSADATGGKGNAALISWDYGKEITVTLEDALFSPKSLAIMFGNGTVSAESASAVKRTETFTATATSTSAVAAGWDSQYTTPKGTKIDKDSPSFFDETGSSVATFTSGNKYFCTYDLEANKSTIEISANSFPGTYYVTGDTYARSETTGDDDFFQFIIPKAKMLPENTITLEAEGDPSVFNMSLKVLRPADGVMMKLVKYGV